MSHLPGAWMLFFVTLTARDAGTNQRWLQGAERLLSLFSSTFFASTLLRARRALAGALEMGSCTTVAASIAAILLLGLEVSCMVIWPAAVTPLVLALIFQVQMGVLLVFQYSRALARLREAVDRASQGSFSEEIVPQARKLGRVGDSFGELLRGLASARHELVENHLESVKAIALAMEARDSDTQGHCLRVRYLARRILDRLEVDPAYRKSAEAAALLHDVGKIGIPDSLLLKRERLTAEEYARVMLHVEIGVEILRPLTTLREAVIFVKHHHERFDGTGYPDHLTGEQIPLASRVISVADAIDAMRSSRPYRKALSLEETVLELKRSSGKQLDPRIVEIAISVLVPGGAGDNLSIDPTGGERSLALQPMELERA